MDYASNRTTELFVNYADHLQLDALGFTPIATVISNGMNVIDQFTSSYGEMSDACDLHGFRPCDGPVEASILAQGNAYLDQGFPGLTRIFSAAIVDTDESDDDSDDSDDSDGSLPVGARVQLHCHLDGSVPPEQLLSIARRRRLRLPGLGGRLPETVDDIWMSLRSMGPIWRWFDLVNEVVGGDEAALFDIAYAFVGRQASEGVAYAEVRWDPIRPAASSLANASIGVDAAIRAVARGLRAGGEAYGVEIHQLLCAMRGSPGAKCFELARIAANARTGELGGVVGMDLAGDEYHFNNSAGHVESCLRFAKRELQLNTTVHAGEMADDEYSDVSSAVEVMQADRIGHGYAAIQSPDVLLMLMRRPDVHVEACPGGRHDNLRATGIYRTHGLNFGLSTDDPTEYFGNLTMPQVEALVKTRLGFSDADIARAHRLAYAARFAPHAARIVRAGEGGALLSPTDGSAAGNSSAGLVAVALVALVVGLTCSLAAVRSWFERRARRGLPPRGLSARNQPTTHKASHSHRHGLPPELTTASATVEVM